MKNPERFFIDLAEASRALVIDQIGYCKEVEWTGFEPR